MKEKTVFVGSSQVRVDHSSDPYYLPQHQELGQMSTKLVLFIYAACKFKQKNWRSLY